MSNRTNLLTIPGACPRPSLSWSGETGFKDLNLSETFRVMLAATVIIVRSVYCHTVIYVHKGRLRFVLWSCWGPSCLLNVTTSVWWVHSRDSPPPLNKHCQYVSTHFSPESQRGLEPSLEDASTLAKIPYCRDLKTHFIESCSVLWRTWGGRYWHRPSFTTGC